VSTLVVGDVHGCADELRTLLDAVDADRVVLVGDLFTKGPDPVGVWRLIRDRGLEAVRGNHDQRLLDAIDRGRRGGAVRAVIAKLDAADPDWRAWTAALPLFADAGPFTVVHAALHPSGDRDATPPKVALSLRRWPHDRPDDPRWWRVYTGGPVVFGHDARQGLVQRKRNGRRWVIGIDTGCVYGGHLTGWVQDEDRLIQIPARRAYLPV